MFGMGAWRSPDRSHNCPSPSRTECIDLRHPVPDVESLISSLPAMRSTADLRPKTSHWRLTGSRRSLINGESPKLAVPNVPHHGLHHFHCRPTRPRTQKLKRYAHSSFGGPIQHDGPAEAAHVVDDRLPELLTHRMNQHVDRIALHLLTPAV